MLPILSKKPNQIDLLTAFLGLNKNFKIEDAEFSDTKNMTNDYFPVFSNRKKRGVLYRLNKPMGMLGGKYLSYVDDNKLYYDEQLVCDLEANDNERQLVMMGAYLCVFPDGVIYNTYTHELDYIEKEVTTTTPPTFNLTKLDGTRFNSSNTVTSEEEPEDRTKYWIDTSMDTVVIKMYSTTTSMWVSVGTTYIRAEAPGIGEGFSKGDALLFSDVDESAAIYNGLNLNQTNLIYDAGKDYLVIAGFINQVFTNSKNITVKRELPKMDFVCELQNRIWGCSSENHEIYACKLGDAKNWNCFAGLDNDSYAATIGTEDVFTGAVAYAGYVLFFKEQGFHKVFGTKPSNFEVVWKPCRGVQNGSEKSLAVVNEMLIYKAKDAICAFDGSVTKISDKINDTTYYDGVAGVYRDKYYISLRDQDYNYGLYVFDTIKNIWLKEDDTEIKYAAFANGGLYIVDRNFDMFLVNNEKIYVKKFPQESIYPKTDTKYPDEILYPGNSELGKLEDNFEWSFETGDMGDNSPYHKYIKRIDMKLWLDISSYLKIEIMYDSSEQWLKVIEMYCTRKKTFDLPISIQRCDHFRLRISGHGDFKLYSIAKVTETGTDSGGES